MPLVTAFALVEGVVKFHALRKKFWHVFPVESFANLRITCDVKQGVRAVSEDVMIK